MNNQDDLARGKGNNPFGNYRDASPVQTKSPNGPFPGDESIFSFNLYRDAALQNRVGVAVFTCEYDFGKNAFCDVAFELTKGGTMLAEGFFNFEATAFTLAVTGGYGGLEGEKGTVEETPSTNHAERLRFELEACSHCGATAGGQASGPGAEHLLLDSVLAKQAFVNNADDRARGQGHNPFGNPSSAVTPPENEKIYGPFAGDEGEYAFTLDAPGRHRAGAAIFVCQYDFDASSFCDADLFLSGGDLVLKGVSSFEGEKFTLGIVGGTGDYRGATGTVQVTARGAATQPQPVTRAAPMIQSQRLAITVARPPASPTERTLVRYSNVTQELFVNNDDDEARGDVNNPFGFDEGRAAANEESAGGPFPGDESLFAFGVFDNSHLRPTAGSGVYTCQYYFAKNGFCEVSFQLEGGTLDADGAIDFGARSWTMSVTGGTGSYAGLSGDVTATPAGRHAQRLEFHLG